MPHNPASSADPGQRGSSGPITDPSTDIDIQQLPAQVFGSQQAPTSAPQTASRGFGPDVPRGISGAPGPGPVSVPTILAPQGPDKVRPGLPNPLGADDQGLTDEELLSPVEQPGRPGIMSRMFNPNDPNTIPGGVAQLSEATGIPDAGRGLLDIIMQILSTQQGNRNPISGVGGS